MIVIGLTSWEGTARFVRAEFLSLRELDFVAAAKALGVDDMRIIFRHMVPNAIGPVLVSGTIGIASAILTEAGLSFLGFGVPPPHATWGNILADGKRFIFDAPWLTFIPGAAILIVVLAFNLFGEGLRDILNPRLREKH
jgi:peptide/nickel transport system permease protein